MFFLFNDVKVMNFYRLSNMSIIKAVALFEELETVVILPMHQETTRPSKKRKDITDLSSHIVITAGERGTLRTFLLEYQVTGVSSTIMSCRIVTLIHGTKPFHASQCQH
jgi:hypothetical protein